MTQPQHAGCVYKKARGLSCGGAGAGRKPIRPGDPAARENQTSPKQPLPHPTAPTQAYPPTHPQPPPSHSHTFHANAEIHSQTYKTGRTIPDGPRAPSLPSRWWHDRKRETTKWTSIRPLHQHLLASITQLPRHPQSHSPTCRKMDDNGACNCI